VVVPPSHTADSHTMTSRSSADFQFLSTRLEKIRSFTHALTVWARHSAGTGLAGGMWLILDPQWGEKNPLPSSTDQGDALWLSTHLIAGQPA
jgi:hypothetical protein